MNTSLPIEIIERPQWWFRPIHEQRGLESEPRYIEYLKVWTGETFIHSGGTAFWNHQEHMLDIQNLMLAGITHWRLVEAHRDVSQP